MQLQTLVWYNSALLAGFHERYPNGLVAGIPVQYKKRPLLLVPIQPFMT